MTGAGGASARPQKPGRSVGLILSGPVGLAGAVLLFFGVSRLSQSQGVLIHIPLAEIAVFAVLLAVSLLEIPVMLIGLRHMHRSSPGRALLTPLNAIFVGFPAVYASVQTLLFGESTFSLVLVGFSLARWLGGLWLI